METTEIPAATNSAAFPALAETAEPSANSAQAPMQIAETSTPPIESAAREPQQAEEPHAKRSRSEVGTVEDRLAQLTKQLLEFQQSLATQEEDRNDRLTKLEQLAITMGETLGKLQQTLEAMQVRIARLETNSTLESSTISRFTSKQRVHPYSPNGKNASNNGDNN